MAKNTKRVSGSPHAAFEARGLPRSIGDAEIKTRAALGWQPLACPDPAKWCVWNSQRPADR